MAGTIQPHIIAQTTIQQPLKHRLTAISKHTITRTTTTPIIQQILKQELRKEPISQMIKR